MEQAEKTVKLFKKDVNIPFNNITLSCLAGEITENVAEKEAFHATCSIILANKR